MAVKKITMPQLGESVTEGTISKWLVGPGDHVNKYDPLAEVMTDKVNAEIPSSFSGIIKELVAQEGDTLAVGELICHIDTESSGDSGKADAAEPAAEVPVQESKQVPAADTANAAKGRYSPAVVRLAGEHGIDLNGVSGTGLGGRITRKDIQKLIDSGERPQAASKPQQDRKDAASAPAASPAPAAAAETKLQPVQVQAAHGDIEIPVSGVRKAIAANMVRSKHEAPHAWTMVEVDVTNLVNFRNSVKGDFKAKEGYNITFLPFFIKAVTESLKEYPQINSMWAGDKIIQKKDINISIAVATDDALYVPVIKHADEKSVKGIAREVNELAGKVRSGKLSGDDMKGGTFTVNNTGSFGSIMSTPIINYPQAAIMSVESIVKRPVIIDGMIAVRDMVNLCLSLDHRVLDGLVCGRFLASVKQRLEGMTKENTPLY
ncbi:dihydrolipoamide acetyltransferase family protein [Fictibacillus aquaticus]|uniref:Dihydrolipoamide acetyltransferase component of pyruvate dehydrogenase complex n=1 Tax=Fictibacillus aquaticus TaxID=2021314 RepID=A0A235FC33_9BACL|nr:dihydrolipoamide acetyltransferase family protein [Fictibacillus aquaticus]OYD58345.1 branched-chain alpha-keto acid dehydrogenase subunit E2 [Fictibacillus aquaticus]